MVDYSRIDWAKCRLHDWSGRRVKLEAHGASLVTLSMLNMGVFARLVFSEKQWYYEKVHVWGDIKTAKSYTDSVDTFIATETARIEAEDEAKRQELLNKPWRPCSKEFALKHPKESEYRYRYSDACEWFPWGDIMTFSNTGVEYEFRTTAKAEPKSRVVAEVAVSDIRVKESVEYCEPRIVSHEISVDFKGSTCASGGFTVFGNGYIRINNGKNPRIVLIVDEVE